MTSEKNCHELAGTIVLVVSLKSTEYKHKHSTWIAIITRVPGQIIKVGISTCSSTKIGDFTH